MKNLKTVGAQVIYDIEVFNEPMRSLSAAERARQIFESSSAVVAHA